LYGANLILRPHFAFALAERARYANANRAEQHHPDFQTSVMLYYEQLHDNKNIYIAIVLFKMNQNIPRLSSLTLTTTSHLKFFHNGISSTSHHRRDRQARRLSRQRPPQSKRTIRDSRSDTQCPISICAKTCSKVFQDQARDWRLQQHQRHIPASQDRY
jgi:hypothetical protein